MRRTRQLISALAILSTLALSNGASAGDKDPDGLIAVAEAMNDHVAKKYDDALKKLDEALKNCAGNACEASTRAQLLVSRGIVLSGKKDTNGARESFELALNEDPKVVPDRQFMNKDLNKIWSDAKQNVKKGIGAGGPKRPPPSKQQLDAVSAAQAQLAQKNWSDCMGTILGAMTEREFALGKLVLAQCEDAGGLLLEASSDVKLAIQYAEEEVNQDVKKKALDLQTRLENDTPTITVQIPKTIDDPVLSVDGVVIPKEKADKPIPHNPGKATIEVKGKRGAYPFTFKTTESFERGERITVNVEQAAGQGNSSVFQCIQNARTPAEVNLCIETGGKGRGLTLRGGLEFFNYNDSVNVNVSSPTAFFSAENPTAGWRVGASYTVDIVSNASPDIVAMASRRFDEVRNAGSIAGEIKAGPARIGLDVGVSIEPDYIGRSVGAAVSADLRNKTLTPALAYHLSFDILGKRNTPKDVFSRNIYTHTIDLGMSIVANATTIIGVAGTAEILMGDTSKPYRHIPMFAADVAARIPRGASPDLVSGVRLPVAPFEQLPDFRARFAIAGRAAHRFESATLRAEERLYADTWGLKASTTDVRVLFDVGKQVRLGPHARFHIQGPVSFWQRAYVATPTSSGWELPQYRAGDRELGPLFSTTLGMGVRLQVTDIFAIGLQAEGMYTQFLDAIYVYDRWGVFSATTLEFGVE